MIYFRGCPRALSSALLALVLIAFFLLLHQSKQLYDDHQKYLRLQRFKQYMNEVATSMKQVEKEASVGISQLENLNQVLQHSPFVNNSTLASR